MPHDARAVANLLLDLADVHGLRLTHMAVHKIAYFAHGWHLVAKGHPLIAQPFEAWKYGPILRPVWNEFKDAKDKPILSRASLMDVETGELLIAASDFDAEERGFVGHILQAYGRFPATRLSDMTHRRGGAWEKVWHSGAVVVGMRITDEAIRADLATARLPLGNASN